MTPIDAIVTRLLALHPKRIDLTLDRVERLLARLDNPQRRLPPVIHVAGTNGKGSTVAFMRAILEAAGKSVHVYTSPNLVRVNERFRLGRAGGGVLVSDAELADVLTECERTNGDDPITVFEIETVAGFLLFARHPADVLLLEVGLGGRLDATNVIERPLTSVITPVSFDHAEFLGNTVPQIAAEKAGILKRDVPAVIALQSNEARETIERVARQVGAPLRLAGEDWIVTQEHGRLVYQDENGLLDLPAPKLVGRHQFDNAGTAIAALRASNAFKLPLAAYEDGIAAAQWPARMQRLLTGRLVAQAPEGAEVWLDGGHNVDGGRAIAVALADLEERVPRPLVLIVGMLTTKDVEGFLGNLAGLAHRVIAIPIANQEKARSPETIVEAARRTGTEAEVSTGTESALARVAQLNLDAPRILITGSLYLAGEVLAANGTPPT
ncbi:MAG: bifunctional folylpolyglutamate synthase/dihydrofolate synthase [Rhizobiales bacterium]|nr:bifunctional folylpolyglutamate synthase/dihydrofolate synthase [Hyphomicrobiales bacterium]